MFRLTKVFWGKFRKATLSSPRKVIQPPQTGGDYHCGIDNGGDGKKN